MSKQQRKITPACYLGSFPKGEQPFFNGNVESENQLVKTHCARNYFRHADSVHSPKLIPPGKLSLRVPREESRSFRDAEARGFLKLDSPRDRSWCGTSQRQVYRRDVYVMCIPWGPPAPVLARRDARRRDARSRTRTRRGAREEAKRGPAAGSQCGVDARARDRDNGGDQRRTARARRRRGVASRDAKATVTIVEPPTARAHARSATTVCGTPVCIRGARDAAHRCVRHGRVSARYEKAPVSLNRVAASPPRRAADKRASSPSIGLYIALVAHVGLFICFI